MKKGWAWELLFVAGMVSLAHGVMRWKERNEKKKIIEKCRQEFLSSGLSMFCWERFTQGNPEAIPYGYAKARKKK